jgi:hypothetical protein
LGQNAAPLRNERQRNEHSVRWLCERRASGYRTRTIFFSPRILDHALVLGHHPALWELTNPFSGFIMKDIILLGAALCGSTEALRA